MDDLAAACLVTIGADRLSSRRVTIGRGKAGKIAAGLVIAAVALPVAACTANGGNGVHGTRQPGRTHATAPSPGSTRDRGEPGYLALGDSIAFGYRPLTVTTPTDYLNAADFAGYPENLARTLRLRLVNASCPGETTASMIDVKAPSNGCETTPQGGPGYRGFAPLHVSYSGSQLGYAVRYLRRHLDTRLVTIDIGINDIFVCQETTADRCTGADLVRALDTVTGNVYRILAALRDDAHYRHALVVVDYYALNYSDQASVTQTRALNAALAGPAAKYGARIANAVAAFQAASASAAGDTCAAGLRIKLPAGGCDLHPSALGQRVLAMAIRTALGHDAP